MLLKGSIPGKRVSSGALISYKMGLGDVLE
jgi:hypothetical protein